MLGLAFVALLTIQTPSALSPNTIVSVQTAPAQPGCTLFCGEFTLMTLAEAQRKYDELVKFETPTQRQIQLLAALRISISTIEGNQVPGPQCTDTPQRCETLRGRRLSLQRN